MNAASIQRIVSFATFEFNRFLFSKRGLIAIISYLSLWAIVLTQVIAKGADAIRTPQFERFISAFLGEVGLDKLSSWQVPELIVFWLVAALSFPIFSIFVGADQLCSDKSRGTIRFLLLRAQRFEVQLGRFIGQVAVVCVFILLSLIATNLLVITSDNSALLASLSRSLSIFVDLVLIILPILGFLALINTYTNSSKQAIVHCFLFLTLGTIIIGLLHDYLWQGFSILGYVLPLVDLSEKLRLEASFFQHILFPIVQTLAYLVGAIFIFKKQAV